MSKRKKYNRPEKHEIPKVPPPGFRRLNGKFGKAKVYSDGKRFITPDLDQHIGG